MCGIAGIFSYHNTAPAVEREELHAIRDHMTTRGPDGYGEWYSDDQRVAIGHRRLSIIDLSYRAAQPMATSDGQFVISFNGEIYNYHELRKSLESKGRVFFTESDTEVLLHLYAEKGEAMLGDLRGMFAFAIWDAVRKELFIARDPFGIKPLYYADNGKTFRFASQVKALLAGGKIDTSPQPAGHAGFFLWGSVPEPWTLYSGIHALPAGHRIKISARGIKGPSPFCRVTDVLDEALDNPAQGSRTEAIEAIAAAIRDSVRAHLIADVPVGLFLSAGLDSAMITALASSSGNQLRTLTLSFDEYAGIGQDEAPLAEAIGCLFGTRHTTVRVQQQVFEEECERMFAAMDQPSIDGVNTWFVARAAAQAGMRAALSGVGGDELLGSYPSFRDVPRIKRFARTFTRIPGFGRAFRQLSHPLLARMTSPKYAGLLEYGASTGGAYLLRRGLYMHWELPAVLDPEFAREGWQELRAFDELNRIAHTGRDKEEQRITVSALEMNCYMRNQLLRDTDWAGMAHSLEIRVPFADIVLLRNTAPWLAAHPSIRKSEIAAFIAPNLPATVLKRPKTGFSVPVREWLLAGQQVSRERGLRGWARHVHRTFAGKKT